jgi:hypothetical protein
MKKNHFDNIPSQFNDRSFKIKQQINKFLIPLNIFLKWAEIIFLPILLIFCIYFVFTQKPECISGNCGISWIDLNLGFFRLEYSQSLFNFIVDYAMPFLAIDGLVRIGLTFWINKKEGGFEWLFYLGLIGFAVCYFLLSRNFESFLYISSSSEKVFDEPIIVEFVLGCLILSGFLVFRDKYNWDRASFFTKFRLMFYSFHLVVCIININFGVLLFLISLPFQVTVDLRRKNHIHYDDSMWLEQ